ncbi:cation:proton antiporter [bacterium]|nr:cation:proton antiporter [bacterium]
MDILFFIGLALICGFIGGKLARLIKLPSVVGYLLAGLLLGNSVFNIFSLNVLDRISIFSDFALGIVAFIIGSEMRIGILRKLGKGILTILLGESLGAVLLVTLGTYLLTRQFHIALIFGALAAATAPAGTVAVLQEYKSKGNLTNTIYAIVGLDDGVAVVIYAFAAAFAKMFLTGNSVSFVGIIKGPVIEILGSILLGGLMGIIFGYFLRKLHRKTEILAVSLGGILICTGLSNHFNLSLILANMSLAVVFTNIFLFANRRAYESVNLITTSIFIVFFVIAGAHLQIKLLPAMGLVGLIYILSRSVGKMGGAYLGAVTAKAKPVIRRYLGLGLLPQAGVAIGLAILATKEFGGLGETGAHLSILVINTIAATTIFFEIIGPITTKFAISKAGEIGKKKTSRY